MKTHRIIGGTMAALVMLPLLSSCNTDKKSDLQEVDPALEEEWYSGGKLGTTFNSSSSAYEDPTPATEEAGLADKFKYGEYFFERTYTQNTAPFKGLGPLYYRSSCMSCHPGYGHGRRMTRYKADEWGNGYLIAITNQDDEVLSSMSLLPHTKAVEPFKPIINEDGIKIQWLDYTDEWGNKFPDGKTYSLIYPEVTIDENAFYLPLEHNGVKVPYSDIKIRLESTIGIYGTGLLDAIDESDLKAQYLQEEKYGVSLNPAIFANGEWTVKDPATGVPYRFDYALDRSSVMSDAGLWEALNITRSNFRSMYIPAEYIEVAAKDPDVQARFYEYFPEWNKTGNPETDIRNYLSSTDLPIEMSDEDYVNFMVWHRGLAVPAARDLDDPQVLLGRKLFREIGCSHCHRPSWTTGDDNYKDPYGRFKDGDARLPRYPHQTIWPYTDMVQHRLFMKNDIRTGWCRTTPLWGRGLSPVCAGHQDRLHDCRARNVIEAIMWHGSAQSDARSTVEKFRNLSYDEREAVVRFINSI